MLLELAGVTSGYGRIQILWGVDLQVGEGEIVALIGSNGAGKTTCFRAISGLLPVWSGGLTLDGRDQRQVPAHLRARLGVSQAPEGRQLFPGLSVRDNILLGAYTVRDRKEVARRFNQVVEVFPELANKLGRPAGTLSGGEQQMCSLARALAARPRLLLVDELSLGLAPLAVERLKEALLLIRRSFGASILLVEQDVETGLSISDRAYVLEHGRVAKHGPSKELLDNPEIKAAYLGV